MENSNSLLKHFILMVGIPASGKSTLSKALRDNLIDCTLIEFDKIEQNLASTSKSDSFDPEIWHKARDLAF
jgi:dephospho-CoA kinase